LQEPPCRRRFLRLPARRVPAAKQAEIEEIVKIEEIK
jgi:hypothetical protein